MEEVYRIGPKNLQTNFGLKNFSRQEMFLVICWCRKSLVMSTPKTNRLMYLYDPDVPGIQMNTSLNMFQVNFSVYFSVSIFIVLLARSSE